MSHDLFSSLDSFVAASSAASSLLVRDVGGAYRPAEADEVLQAAQRVLASRVRGAEVLTSPAVVKDFLRARMTAPIPSKTPRRAPIGRRPAADPATAWVHRENTGDAAGAPAKSEVFTARLTIDVTPALRGRIKVIAFGRGITAADMLRELLEREYAEDKA